MVLSTDAIIEWSGAPGSRLITLHAGTLTLNGDLSSVYPGISIAADNAAVIHLSATQHIKQLTLLNSTTLDLGATSLFVAAPQPQDTLANIRNLIKSGNIVSSTTQSNAQAAIGYAFDATSTSVKMMATLLGDLNLDRNVSISDFIDLSSHFGQSSANWSDGDLNYDDQVSIADFITLAANFGQNYSPGAAQAQPAAGMAVVTQEQERIRRKPKREQMHHRRDRARARRWYAPSRQWIIS
jgi:hypothetical protein